MAESTGTTSGSETRSEHLFCPYCGTEDAKDAEFCDHCGERVFAPDPSRHQTGELGNCANCSTLTLVHAHNCVGCGVSLDKVKPRPYQVPEADASLRDAVYGRPSRPTPLSERRGHALDRWPFPSPKSERGEIATERGRRATLSRPPIKEEPNDSGTKDARLPKQLRGFNWGAFLLGPIWGVGNKVWIAAVLFLLHPMLLPQWLLLPTALLFYGVSVFLGFRGSELAWRARKWLSAEHFRRTQRAWSQWGIAINGFMFVIILMMRASSPAAG